MCETDERMRHMAMGSFVGSPRTPRNRGFDVYSAKPNGMASVRVGADCVVSSHAVGTTPRLQACRR